MRKMLVSNMVTADGFFAGTDDDISWHNVDAEFNEYAIELLTSVDALIFGRRTYELMAAYWPTAHAIHDDPAVAGHMNSLSKLVLSTTLAAADWQNSVVLAADVATTLTTLKQQPGKDLVILGSGRVVASLTDLHLIDEYRLIVNPVLLGTGRSLFDGIHEEVRLDLASVRPFRSGNVLLTYHAAPGKALP